MFQDLYAKADGHIATHIKTLSRRQLLPTSTISSQGTRQIKDVPARIRSSSSRDTLNSVSSINEQQMLTPEEIFDRRRVRRLLEHKKVALEEAVERRVCERIYTRIWRHRSTIDEARDEKLQSKIAALALVGINLKDLGVEVENENAGPSRASEDNRTEDRIEHARAALLKMNEERSPLGKLQQLALCHKRIVDLLTEFLRSDSSASADAVLPALIYTLIRSPPEGTNFISNLQYIQRFRNASKIDGEAAYCLTNFEAAISFLETVDLASLRADEKPEGPVRSSSSSSKLNSDMIPIRDDNITSAENAGAHKPTIAVSDHPLSSPTKSSDKSASLARPPSHTRRSSNILEPATNAIGAAGDAVKSTADQGLKTVSTALDTSFQFFFGRMRERQQSLDEGKVHKDFVPKTLDDARKLVEPKSDDDEALSSETSSAIDQSIDGQMDGVGMTANDSLLTIFSGRQQTRDRSVDSSRSGGSGKRNINLPGTSPLREIVDPTSSPMSGAFPAAPSAVDSMKSFGNAINPLNRFSGMNVMKGFGKRTTSGTLTPAAPANNPASKANQQGHDSEPQMSYTDHNKSLPLKSPPLARFVNMENATELRVGELEELLQDYKRLAAALSTSE